MTFSSPISCTQSPNMYSFTFTPEITNDFLAHSLAASSTKHKKLCTCFLRNFTKRKVRWLHKLYPSGGLGEVLEWLRGTDTSFVSAKKKKLA